MLFRFTKNSDVRPSEITPLSVYKDRRRFLGSATAGAAALAAPGLLLPGKAEAKTFEGVVKTAYGQDLKLNSKKDVTSYNNFYELGTDKEDPARNGHLIKPRPWAIEFSGELEKPGVYDVDMLIPATVLEERIYRLRCVEGWSMVIPWVGISLASVLKRFGPTSKAKYVAFETLVDPEQMPGVQRPVIEWPYREGLRIDEAMNPLSFLAVGLYGESLPGQNGTPVRLVVPWKYGFKSIKSIVAIRFSETEPKTSWNMSLPQEYGFYANVNPTVDHPRWSQARERRIGDFFKTDTLMFNGYEEEVADMYHGMDLAKNY